MYVPCAIYAKYAVSLQKLLMQSYEIPKYVRQIVSIDSLFANYMGKQEMIVDHCCRLPDLPPQSGIDVIPSMEMERQPQEELLYHVAI